MAGKYLINGGNASNTNIYYWSIFRVTVGRDSVTEHYQIANGGRMIQRCHLPVRGSFQVSGTYFKSALEDELVCKVTTTLENDEVFTHFEILSEYINAWSAFRFTVELPEDISTRQIEFDIYYNGASVGRVSTLSASAAFDSVVDSIPLEDFVAKCITYGLDADKPDLLQIYEEEETE